MLAAQRFEQLIDLADVRAIVAEIRSRRKVAGDPMTIPLHAFELLYGRDSRQQLREFENLGTAVEAANSLRPVDVDARLWAS